MGTFGLPLPPPLLLVVPSWPEELLMDSEEWEYSISRLSAIAMMSSSRENKYVFDTITGLVEGRDDSISSTH